MPSLEQQDAIVAQIEIYEAEMDKLQGVIDNYIERRNEIFNRYLK